MDIKLANYNPVALYYVLRTSVVILDDKSNNHMGILRVLNLDL